VFYSQGPKDIPRKSSLPTAKSSRRPVDFSDSEREESEYETDGEEDERSPPRKRAAEPEQEYDEEEEEEEEEHEEEAEVKEASEEDEEEEAEVCPFLWLIQMFQTTILQHSQSGTHRRVGLESGNIMLLF
jgi:hypothetical protein